MHTGLLIIITAALGAVISGLFGMAGGMVFMGVIAALMSVPAAMVTHGIVQSISNTSRAWMLRPDVRWDILAWTALGAVPMVGVMIGLSIKLNTAELYLALGGLPALLWLPRGWLAGDAEKPLHAMGCGALVMGLNLSAGVAGPALDFFYVRTELVRRQIVATKAVIMSVSHLVKIAYFGIPLVLMAQDGGGMSDLPPFWVFAVALPCIIAGSKIGTTLLNRFSDIGFRKYTRVLVSVIGVVYIWRGAVLMGWV